MIYVYVHKWEILPMNFLLIYWFSSSIIIAWKHWFHNKLIEKLEVNSWERKQSQCSFRWFTYLQVKLCSNYVQGKQILHNVMLIVMRALSPTNSFYNILCQINSFCIQFVMHLSYVLSNSIRIVYYSYNHFLIHSYISFSIFVFLFFLK